MAAADGAGPGRPASAARPWWRCGDAPELGRRRPRLDRRDGGGRGGGAGHDRRRCSWRGTGCAAAGPGQRRRPTPAPPPRPRAQRRPRRRPRRSPAHDARRRSSWPRLPCCTTLPSGQEVPVSAVGHDVCRPPRRPVRHRPWPGWWRGGSRLGDPFGSILLAAPRRLADAGPGPLRRAADRLPGRTHPPGLGAPDADVRGQVTTTRAPGRSPTRRGSSTSRASGA